MVMTRPVTFNRLETGLANSTLAAAGRVLSAIKAQKIAARRMGVCGSRPVDPRFTQWSPGQKVRNRKSSVRASAFRPEVNIGSDRVHVGRNFHRQYEAAPVARLHQPNSDRLAENAGGNRLRPRSA
jgi:hypothetical protein